MDGPPTNLLTPGRFLALLRALWVALGITLALALRDAGGLVSVAWWIVVAAGVVALVVPSAAGLTGLRMVVPVTPVVAVIALVDGPFRAWSAAALAVALLASAVVLSAEVGEAMVQGSAYGHEQRFPLRAPAALLPPMAISWLLWAASVVGAPLLLRDRQWLAGVVVGIVAAALTWLLAGRFHRLSRRWLVLVPVGVVVHDHVVLGETLMVQRSNFSVAQLAPADTQAADLTGPAAGNAVEVSVREMVLAVFPSTREHPKGRALHVQSFLVSPSRPGRALMAMTASNLRVG